MKQLTINLMAAAVAVLAAGSASAQTLKADIPFTFHAAGAVMTAGTYEIRHASSSNSKYVIIRNTDTKKSVFAIYEKADVAKALKAQGTPGIQFECAGARCALREIWTDSGSSAYHFSGPKLGSEGDKRMAFIPLTLAKAD